MRHGVEYTSPKTGERKTEWYDTASEASRAAAIYRDSATNYAERVVTEAFTVTPAAYAKGKMIVRTSDGSGYKTRAAYLIEALGGRYVGRSRGYVMSPAAVEKLHCLFDAGFDAALRIFGDTPARLFHRDRNLNGLTVAQAMKLAKVAA